VNGDNRSDLLRLRDVGGTLEVTTFTSTGTSFGQWTGTGLGSVANTLDFVKLDYNGNY